MESKLPRRNFHIYNIGDFFPGELLCNHQKSIHYMKKVANLEGKYRFFSDIQSKWVHMSGVLILGYIFALKDIIKSHLLNQHLYITAQQLPDISECFGVGAKRLKNSQTLQEMKGKERFTSMKFRKLGRLSDKLRI